MFFLKFTSLSSLALLLLTGTSQVRAQEKPAVAASRGVALKEARALLATRSISAELANVAVLTAVRECRRLGHAVGAVAMTSSGLPIAQLQGDGARLHASQSAALKARAAATYGIDTDKARGRSPVHPIADKIPDIALANGGLVILHEGEVVGTIGVGGANVEGIDVQCARAGVEAVTERLRVTK